MTLHELDELERAVLEKLLAGDLPVLVKLRQQLNAAQVDNREKSGHGFFTTLTVDRSVAEPVPVSNRFGDVVAEIQGLEQGAGFVLMIEDGYLHMLEGYAYDEAWPEEIGKFSLSYAKEPRDLSPLDQ